MPTSRAEQMRALMEEILREQLRRPGLRPRREDRGQSVQSEAPRPQRRAVRHKDDDTTLEFQRTEKVARLV